MSSTASRNWWIAGALLAAVATAIRVGNAFHYPVHYGFDAPANWDYIEQLLASWRMPAPGEGWATSHPPFFYYLSASLGRLMTGAGKAEITVAIRLLSSAIGLLGVGAAALLVWRSAPGDRARCVVAAALLLFLPVHIYMSAMLGEEILASALASFALVGAAHELARPAAPRRAALRMALLGLLAGLAFLTKLTGILAIGAIVAAFALDGLRRRELRAAALRAGVFAVVALAVGGWPYARNQIEYGYLYPEHLEAHEIMFTMPPGERGVGDYLRFPLATFRDPQVLAPELLHSVWGTTYTTLFFDGHRVVLPRSDPTLTRVGTALLVLGLLPTLAFAVGMWRGAKRALASPDGPDTLLLLLVAATLGGFVLFTWRAPWYATVKGSYLLGIAVPYAYYASEVLLGWARSLRAWHAGQARTPLGAALIWAPLCALFALSALTFTVDLVWVKREGPGFVWPRVDPTPHYERAIPAPRTPRDAR